MGDETRFFERQLDRTAYTACWWLALVVALFTIGLASLFWTIGTVVKHKVAHTHITLPQIHLRSVATPDPSAILQSAQNAAAQAKLNAEAQAKAAAQAELDKQAASAKTQVQTQSEQQLNNFLGQ